MNKIKELLSQEQTKIVRDKTVALVLEDNSNMKLLMECFFADNYRMNQYASWAVTVIGEKEPQLILPYLNSMIAALDNPKHDAVVRNTVRLLQFIDIPEELEGKIYDKCFEYLNNPKKATAIRVFSMSVLAKIAMKYPELKEELIKSIELYYSGGSKGFKSRANHIKSILK